MRLTVFVALLCGMVLATAAPALADTPIQNAYSGTGANQITQAQTGSNSSAKTLPFTGIDLGTLSVVGFVLLGTGFVLRRRSSSGH